MKYFVLVTGASTGIGAYLCQLLSQQGYHVLAGVRKPEDADRLQQLSVDNIHPLILDVTREEDILQALAESRVIIGHDALVAIINNAGITRHGSILHIPLHEWRYLFEVNFFGLIRTTQLFFPLLITPRRTDDNHPRRIIQMSSVSGIFVSPFIGPYTTSKHALEALSDGLRRELYMHDVQVVLLEPGGLLTPIWNKAKETPSYFGPEHESFQSFKESVIDHNIATGLPVNVLKKYVLRALQSRKVKARYLISKRGRMIRLLKMLPTSMVDRMIRKKLVARTGIRPF